MKNLFMWARKNLALSFFLGLQVLALVMGFVYVVNLQFNPTSAEVSHVYKPEVPSPLFSVEADLENAVETELVAELPEASGQISSGVEGETAEVAARQFVQDKTQVLIMHRTLTDQEMESVASGRQPLVQKEIYLMVGDSTTAAFLIHDEQPSADAQQFVNALVRKHESIVQTRKLNPQPGATAVRVSKNS